MIVETFERAATRRRATVRRTTVSDFDDVLTDRLATPAVGAPIPIEGISLSRHPVALEPTPAELEAAVVGVTGAGPAIAEYGTVVVTSDDWGAEQISLYPETHIAVVAASDIVRTLAEAVDELAGAIDGGLTSAVLTTGPSATADMGAPVFGAHGPENLHILVLEDR